MIRPILRWAHAHRIAVLAAAAVLAIASAASLGRLQFDANVLHLLPRDGVAVPAFRDYLERFGSVDYLYVIVDAPEGTELGDYDETVEALTTALRQAPEIAHVDAGWHSRNAVTRLRRLYISGIKHKALLIRQMLRASS